MEFKQKKISYQGKPFILYCFALIALSSDITAQDKTWKDAKFDDGKIVSQYRVGTRIDEGGQKVPLIEYRTTTTVNADLADCITLLTDIPRHTDFLAAKTSELIKAVSENEWIIYYHFAGSGPFPDFDCIATMAREEDKQKRITSFTVTAVPTLIPPRTEKRYSFYNMTYSFRDAGDGKVEIIVSCRSSPPFAVPQWMVSMGFPAVTSGEIKKILKLVL